MATYAFLKSSLTRFLIFALVFVQAFTFMAPQIGAEETGGTGAITGTVHNPQMEPLSAKVFVFYGFDITNPQEFHTDEYGYFNIPVSQTGHYTVVVQPEVMNGIGYLLLRRDVDVTDANPVHDLGMLHPEQGDVYTGTMVNASGAGIMDMDYIAMTLPLSPSNVAFGGTSGEGGQFAAVIPKNTTNQYQLMIVDSDEYKGKTVDFPFDTNSFGNIVLESKFSGGTATDFAIAGTVLNGSGEPLQADIGVFFGNTLTEPIIAQTGPDGQFNVPVPAAGQYKVVVQPKVANGIGYLLVKRNVELTDASPVQQLDTLVPVEGEVYDGRIADESGVGLGGIEFIALSSPLVPGSVVFGGKTDDTGQFAAVIPKDATKQYKLIVPPSDAYKGRTVDFPLGSFGFGDVILAASNEPAACGTADSTANFKGSVLFKDSPMKIPCASFQIVPISGLGGEETGPWIGQQANENGDYGISLSPGYFRIVQLEYGYDSVYVKSKLHVEFEMTADNKIIVNGVEEVPGISIEDSGIPADDSTGGGDTHAVTGTVYKSGSATPIANGWLQYAKVENGQLGAWIGEPTDENGQFHFNLEPGTYKFVEIGYTDEQGFWKNTRLNDTFTLTQDNTLMHNGTAVESLTVREPLPNFTAVFTEGGTPVGRANVEIVHLDEMESWGDYRRTWADTNEQGQVSLFLRPGNYKIAYIYGSLHEEINKTFEIVSADTPVNMEIDLGADANVMVQLQKNGVDIVPSTDPNVTVEYGINISGRAFDSANDSSQTDGMETKNASGDMEQYVYKYKNTTTGAALFELPPGEYEINGISVNTITGTSSENYQYEHEWISVHYTFTVEATATPDNRQLVTVNLKDPNLTGVLKDKNGQTVSNAWINFKSVETDPNKYPTYNGTGTDSEGNYKINLPSGTYIIEGYGVSEPETGMWKFVQLDIELTVTGESQVYNIEPMPPTISGKLFRKDGITPWPDAELHFLPMNLTEEQKMNAWQYERRTRTESDGSYGIALPDGAYELQAVSTFERWIDLNHYFKVTVSGGVVVASEGFTVVDGSYNIVRPAANVKGVIVNFAGEPLTTGENGQVERGWVNIQEKIDWSQVSPNEFVYPKFYNAEIQPDGSFEANIPEAGEYELQGVGFEKIDQTGNYQWSHMEINASFTLTVNNEAKDLGSIGPNLKGIAAIEGTPVGYGGVIIRPGNMTEQQKQEPWRYEKWVSTDENGRFETYLSPGEYQVFAISGNGQWIEVKQNFTIGSTSVDLGTLQVTTNVTGVVYDKDGNPIVDAWIDIQKGTWPTVEYFGARTDAEGRFKTNLDDGDYTVHGIGLPYHPQENKFGGFLSVNYSFSVVNGEMRTASENGDPITEIVIQPNVSGVVKETLNGEDLVTDAWVTIKPADAEDYDWSEAVWVNTGQTGEFTTFLAPGSYKVVDIGSSTFWKHVDIKFNVNSSGALEAVSGYEAHIANGRLIVAAPEPNVQGVAYGKDGETAEYAWISIQKMDAQAEDFHNSYFWFNTDNAGSFDGRLDDGDYVVTSLSSPREWTELHIEFSIVNGVLEGSAVQEINGKPTLIVKPQVPNVTGIVYDAENKAIANGWISFKPAGAAEHDWSQAKWTETDENGQFELYLTGDVAGTEWVVIHAGNGQRWIDPRLKFTVTIVDGNTTLSSSTTGAVVDNTLNVAPPQPNVNGTVYSDQSKTTPVGYGWFSIVRIDPDTNKVLDHQGQIAKDLNNKEITITDRQNIWDYTCWFNTDDEGNFSMYLENGTYYVLYAGGPNGGFEPGTIFTVSDSGTASDPVEIVPPGDNFTGTVSGLSQEEIEQEYTQYWLKVVDADDSSEYPREWWIPVENDSNAGTDGTGMFQTYLPIGNYEIKGIATPYGFTEVTGETFAIASGGTVTKSISLAGQTAVTGFVYEDNAQLSGKKATVKIIETDASGNEKQLLVQTNSSGKFVFTAREGYTYSIDRVATDLWREVDSVTVEGTVTEAGVVTTVNGTEFSAGQSVKVYYTTSN